MDLFDETYPITEEFDDPSDQCECDICLPITAEEEAYRINEIAEDDIPF